MLDLRNNAERIVPLECGADYVISKPFSANEVLARVCNVLKRAAFRALQDPVHQAPLIFDGITIKFVSSNLLFCDHFVPLTQNEYVNFLVNAPEKVLAHDFIVDRIAPNTPSSNVAIWVHRLRTRIKNASGCADRFRPSTAKATRFSQPRMNRSLSL